MTKGILAFGAYIPWRRLPRKAIAETHGWFNPALKGQAKGERAFCNWDEDAVTMAVEAARDALAGAIAAPSPRCALPPPPSRSSTGCIPASSPGRSASMTASPPSTSPPPSAPAPRR